MSTPRGSPWVVIGAFALIGPPVGGLVTGLMMLFGQGRPVTSNDLSFLLLAPLAGYLVGILPALLTGAVAAVISARIESKMLWVANATVTGAGVSPFFVLAGRFAPELFVVGGIAAFASAIIGLYVRPRWAN